MGENSKIKKWFAAIKAKKHFEIVVAVLAVALMLVLYFSSKSGGRASVKAETPTRADYCERMERELGDAIAKIKGVGESETVVRWESSVETIIAYSTSTSGNSVTTTPTIVTEQGAGAPIVLKELYPKALGVLVICKGGSDVATQLRIKDAVSVLLGISPESVAVYAMQ